MSAATEAAAVPKQAAKAKKQGKKTVVAIASYDVDTPVDGPRTVYRATFDILLQRPSPDARIVIDPATARFRGEFEPLSVYVTSLSDGKGGVVVELEGPRRVGAIAFKDSSRAGKTVELLRLDEDQPAPQPTVTATIGGWFGNVASVEDEFIDVRFTIAIEGESDPLTKAAVALVVVEGEPTGVRLGLVDPAGGDPTFFWPTEDVSDWSVQADEAFAAALQAYVDDRATDSSPTARVVIQSDQECRFLQTAFDTAVSFAQDVFQSLALHASDLVDPDALAVRIAGGADPVSAYLKHQLGGAALVDALNAVVAAGALYDSQRFADVTLSAETQSLLASADDVPRLNRLLLQDAYPDLIAAPAAKRVLRFGGGSVSGGKVAVAVPTGATVSKATIETQESVRADRASDAELAEAPDERSGVRIAGDAATAAAVTIDEAIAVTGLAVPLLALAPATRVAVELQGDHNATPSGKPLARGAAALGAPGSAAWATLFFERVVVPAGPAWLILRAAKGEAVWLATPSGDQLRVRRADDAGTVTEVVLADLAPLFRLFTRSGDALDLPAITLSVGEAAVAGTGDGDRVTYDLTAALKDALATSPTGGVLLKITSAVAGTVTVYPPHVEYVV